MNYTKLASYPGLPIFLNINYCEKNWDGLVDLFMQSDVVVLRCLLAHAEMHVASLLEYSTACTALQKLTRVVTFFHIQDHRTKSR